MPATTIKLPPELKQRVARLIRGTGQSAHAFMLEAIELQTACSKTSGATTRRAPRAVAVAACEPSGGAGSPLRRRARRS
jgi:predicted transcriptional regulator